MLNFLASIVTSLFLTACLPGPTISIYSNTQARIEANGLQVCASTPCNINGYYSQGPFGECMNGADTRLEAFPLDPNNGFRQSKTVYASCNRNVAVVFDMSSGGIINTIEHNSKSAEPLANQASEKLTLLQSLKKKNLISDGEYKTKRKEILDSIK